MTISIIMPLLVGLGIPKRICQTLAWYLLSLMVSADKHTQKFAAKISGKTSSLFSNLLINHFDVSTVALNRAARRTIQRLMKIRAALSKDSPWKIAIIIDATLHQRSTRHTENSKKFNHGKGYVLGHQWTNVGIFIAGQYIPLPPIAFYSKDECKRRGIHYKTEIEKVNEFLRTMPLTDILGPHEHSEIVVIMDSGYDSKKLKNTIIRRKWNFIISLKSDRNMVNNDKQWIRVSTYFNDGRRSWKTFRIKTDGGKSKWRSYATKQLEGNLKGVKDTLKLICSKRSDGKILFLACSNLNVSVKTILYCYQKRWATEIFHRAIKSNLGLEDSGAHKFDTLHAHIHWVYCAYIFLHELVEDNNIGVKGKQTVLEAKIEIQKIKKVIQKATQFSGANKVKEYCYEVVDDIERIYMAA
jgi:hypothetical protein